MSTVVSPSQAEHWSLRTHNGCITMENTQTGNHRTVKIKTQSTESTFAPGKRIALILVGPDNENSYKAFGFVNENKITVFRHYRGTELEKIARMVERPSEYQHKVNYYIEGRCRKCNKRLTTPESIQKGIGPICAG